MVGQLDADPPRSRTGPPDRPTPPRPHPARRWPAQTDMTFAATGQDVPVPARRVGERVEVETRLAFLAAGQMRRGQLPRQPAIAFRAASQHQQMRAGRIGIVGPGAGPATTVRRRIPCACPIPRPLRQTAPPRRGRCGRSARWPADPAAPPPRPALPARWPRRESCTPNARAARHTGRTSESAGCRPAAGTPRACATTAPHPPVPTQMACRNGAAYRRAPAPSPPSPAARCSNPPDQSIEYMFEQQ